MPIPDDEQLEAYLKRFHPMAPQPIKTLAVAAPSRHWFALKTSLTAFAAALIMAMIVWHTWGDRVVIRHMAHGVALMDRRAPAEPLTMRTANTWLATAPSWEAAVDDLAFRPSADLMPLGRQSAFTVLSKEESNHAHLQ